MDREVPVSSGGRDRSVRQWKILNESQLVFESKTDSIDCLAMFNEHNYISGSQQG